MLVANVDDDAIKSDADNNEHIIVEKPEKSTTKALKSPLDTEALGGSITHFE